LKNFNDTNQIKKTIAEFGSFFSNFTVHLAVLSLAKEKL
jgi:hypothetical protein